MANSPDSARAPALVATFGGRDLFITYAGGNGNDVALFTTVPGLAGDYNVNGVVDAADYVLWRNNLGSGTSLPNDDSPGVGPDDYYSLRTQFGKTAGSGSGTERMTPFPNHNHRDADSGGGWRLSRKLEPLIESPSI